MDRLSSYLLLLIISSILFIGCDNWIEGYDDDPNSSPEVSIDNLLTASQVNLFNFSENHLARSIAIWMQQIRQFNRQIHFILELLQLHTIELKQH